MALPAGRRCSSAWEGKGKRVDENTQSFRAHLFTVRVWRDDMGDGQWEWRGKVQHVDSGEAFYFREWQELTARLKAWLQGNITAIEDEDSAEEARKRERR